mgnify:CR=1 FL=1
MPMADGSTTKTATSKVMSISFSVTARVVFENCAIHSKGQGYVTAHYRLSDAETNGYVFLKCKLTGANTDKGVLPRSSVAGIRPGGFHRLLAGRAHQA